MSDEIECTECGWQGDYTMLVCSDDEPPEKPVDQIKFNICPDCGGVDCFEELEDE